MAELFDDLEPRQEQKKKHIPYNGKDGKFTNALDYRAVKAEKEVKRLTTISEYYKRLAERLQEEVYSEMEKRKQLEKKLKNGEDIQRLSPTIQLRTG